MSRRKQPQWKEYKAKRGTGTCKPPPPGLYLSVPFSEYLRWDAINNSSLGAMLESPAAYLWEKDHPKEDTDALRIGRLCHSGKLEPACLLRKFWVLNEECVRQMCRTQADLVPATVGAAKRTNDWPRIVSDLEQANADREKITQQELNIIVGICSSLTQDCVCNALISGSNLEVSWVRRFKVSRRTVCLKGRIDIAKVGKQLGDFKTSRATDDDTIARSIIDFGYHRQASFYQHAWAALTNGDLLPFWAIFAARDKHFEVRAAPYHDDDLDLGEEQWRKALERVVFCQSNGDWPARLHPEYFRLPRWAQPEKEITLDGTAVA